MKNEPMKELPYFVHESSYVDDGAEIGEGTKIWHFSHVMKGARIGKRSIIGQNVNVDGGTIIGSNVKIQNNVSVYTGSVIEDDVFLGPSCVLTNVTNPRSQVNRHSLYETTRLRRGCTIGANATIVCGSQCFDLSSITITSKLCPTSFAAAQTVSCIVAVFGLGGSEISRAVRLFLVVGGIVIYLVVATLAAVIPAL